MKGMDKVTEPDGNGLLHACKSVDKIALYIASENHLADCQISKAVNPNTSGVQLFTFETETISIL